MSKLRLKQPRLRGWVKMSLLALGLLSFSVQAQQRTISGTVTTTEGDTLPGVSILVRGTSTGTVTNFDGAYSLDVPHDKDTLVFTFIGMRKQVVSINGRSSINVQLEEDVELLDDVIVTGYSVDSRRENAGSVSIVKAKDLTAAPSGNVEQQLQGRVAGLTVVTNGQPGTSSQVRVRGFGALGGNEPLYIVDGVPVGSTDFLSPDDIESTTVLKDATAASIYGARAAGGVIVYTTKRGKKEARPMEVFYNGMYGVTTPGQGPEMLSPQEQAEWTWKAIENAATANGEEVVYNHPQYGSGSAPVLPDYLLVGPDAGVYGAINLAEHEGLYNVDPNLGPTYTVIKANKGGTNWYDEMTRVAQLNRHNIGMSGGSEDARYYISLGMQDQDGILLNQNFTRYTLRANSEFDLTDKFRIGENFQTTYRSTTMVDGDAGGQGSADDENYIYQSYAMSPIIPVYDEFGGWAGTVAPGFNRPANPVASLEGRANDYAFNVSTFGNVYAELEPIKDLTLRTSFGGQFGTGSYAWYSRQTYENSENNGSFGFGSGANWNSSWTWTNTANWKKEFEKSKLDILLGQEMLNVGSYRWVDGSGINPFSQNPDYITLSNVQSQVVNGGHGNGINFSSQFSRVNYSLHDKYIASVVMRRDGSSRFGADNRYGFFPAVSGAWRMSSEEFMSGIDWIYDLKLKGGYGIMGNSNNVDPSNQYSLFGTSVDNSSYDIAGTNSSAQSGYYATRIGNTSAKWEKAVTTNIGIDALLFDGSWDIILDVWQKRTTDLLFQVPVTVQAGAWAAAPAVNVGEMLNQGIDLQIVNKGDIGSDWEYEATATVGFLKNEIVALSDGLEDLPGRSVSYRGITPVLNQIGRPLSAFYGYQVEGIFQNEAEVEAHADQEGAGVGRFKYQDTNGDGVIEADDRVYLGSPVPKAAGGFNMNLKYKAWEFNAYSAFSVGNKIYNLTKLYTDFYPLFPGSAISSRVTDSWSTANPDSEMPIYENVSNFSTNTQSNSYYVEDGSYFRLQNITVSYKLPKSMLNAVGFSELKLFASTNNVFTITKYSGLDPSVGGAADTNFGIDGGNYPITRSFTMGVNAAF